MKGKRWMRELLPFAFLPVLVLFFNPTASAIDFYEFQIVAQTGVPLGVGTPVALGKAPSINDSGKVAFIARDTPDQRGRVVVVDNGAVIRDFVIGAPATVDDYVQINEADQVIFRQGFDDGLISHIKRLDTALGGETIASGSYTPVFTAPFDIVLPWVTLNDNGRGVFSADVGSNTVLGSRVGGTGTHDVSPALTGFPNLYPMLADNDTTVVRWGGTQTSPLLRFINTNLDTANFIAEDVDFNAIGEQPGISDDGNVVAFVGDHKTQGLGIYISLFTGTDFTPVKVAGIGSTFSNFSLQPRVGVNLSSTGAPNEYTLVYFAYDAIGTAGLYATSVNITNPAFPVVLNTHPVVLYGDIIPALAGTVDNLKIYDPVNNKGWVVFWAHTTAGEEAIVRALSDPLAKEEGECDPCQNKVGNPINVGRGNKYQREQDFIWNDLAGSDSAAFVRYYNSRTSSWSQGFGANWRSTFSRSIRYSPNSIPPFATVSRPDGKTYRFNEVSGSWVADGDVFDRLESLASGWRYTTTDNLVEIYDANGVLQSISDIRGNTQSLSYDSLNRLARVDANTGEFLLFSYDGQNRISSIIDHAGRSWTYRYDANNNLEFIDNVLDATTRQYHYEDATFPNALTGITDERGIRYTTYGYDAQGRSNFSTRVGNAERVDIVYNADGTRTVTNSLGQPSDYSTVTQLDVSLVTDISGPGCTSCGGSNSSYQYDPANNKLLSRTENGTTTQYGNYDSKGQYAFRIEAVGTAEQWRVDYTYDSRFYNRITTITEPSVIASDPTAQCTVGIDCKITTYVYDAFGNRISETITGFEPGGSPINRTTIWTYGGPLNQLTQVDGPRTDVIDITLYRYYADDVGEGNNRARLREVEDASGVQNRSDIQYTATGKVSSEQGPNGLMLTYTYYPGNDRLETLTETGAGSSRTARWTYLPSGEVFNITAADGTADATTLTFGYDNARRLTRIIDGLGNYIEYTLDTEGNRKEEKTFDATDVLKKQLSQTFDIYNRLDTTSQANESANVDFTPDGTLDQLTDGKSVVSDYNYDTLKRLTQVIQDQGGTDPTTANATITYGYDVQDRLISVIDPINGNTSYLYDDLGNLLSQTSPDTGATTFQYDAAGNLVQKTNALGQLFSYTYDALNRLTNIDAPGFSDDISYLYDNCTKGIERLCTVIYGNSAFPVGNQVHYQYNTFGDLISQGSVQYGYDAQGRVTSIDYPSGARLNYSYDEAGQLDLVNFTVDGITQTLANAISYAPFGPLTALGYGNGLNLSQSFDNAYRMTGQTIAGVLERSYPQYDANGNRLQQTDALASLSSFGYDTLNRLDTANGPFGTRDYDYDKNGNRIQLIADSVTTPATYEPNSNRMDTLGADNVVLDANGNTVINGVWSYSYTPHNRLSSATENSTLKASFMYNGLGQRVSKDSAASRYYLYGPNGDLLVEADGEGNILLEYLYLNGQLLAVFSPDDDQDGQSNQQEADMGTLPANTDNDGDGLTNLTEWFEYGTNSANLDSDGDGAEDGWEISEGTSPLSAASLPAGDGDINRDGEINAGDLVLLYQYVLGTRTPSQSEFVHSDMNQDKELNLQDILKLQQLLLQAWLDGETLLAKGNVVQFPATEAFTWLDHLISPAYAVPTDSGKLYYVHNDLLGTPQTMTNESGSIVWKADYDPFGKATVNEDVDGDGVVVQLNVRFPGQYEDGETGLFYNYHRYYDSVIGRFIRTDPIGFYGGDTNLYGYVFNYPTGLIDPFGLQAQSLYGADNCRSQFSECLQNANRTRARTFRNESIRMNLVPIGTGVSGMLGLISAAGSSTAFKGVIGISFAAGRTVINIAGVIGGLSVAIGMNYQALVANASVEVMERALELEDAEISECRRKLEVCNGQCLAVFP